MITFPCAKINLGLNIVKRRPDGYHNLETVFYPIPLCDALEVCPMDELFPAMHPCDLKVTGNAIDCDEQKNLVMKAYYLLAADHKLPRLHVHLHKQIPSQAGLGGGSSDCAAMITLINEHCKLGLTTEQMQAYATSLGADCPFFITGKPAYATGIGEVLTPIEGVAEQLQGRFIAVVKPPVAVSTKEAYAAITPRKPERCCRDIVSQPIKTWRDALVNDFEAPLFALHPQLSDIKESLYRLGAIYAQMSGSGSALFGIFNDKPEGVGTLFPDCQTFIVRL